VDLDDRGYTIYFITNQAGITKNPATKSDVLGKIQDILDTLALPIQVWVAVAKDRWRKPNTAIIEQYILPNANCVQSLSKIFYVGDAAGRPGDFADTDRKFAYNIYLWMRFLDPNLDKSKHPGFMSETAFFDPARLGNKKEKYSFSGIDPTKYAGSAKSDPYKTIFDKIDELPFMIILIGPPASGKSTLSQAIVSRCIAENRGIPEIINQDTLKTQPACIKAMRAATADGKSIILDKTNPSVKSRQPFIDLTPTNYKLITIYLNTSRELAQHLSLVRMRMNPLIPAIPDVAYNIYYKNLEVPVDAINLPFVAKFASTKHKMYFLQRS
jgi:bifunctional polynucleotide phosphatase/kinase